MYLDRLWRNSNSAVRGRRERVNDKADMEQERGPREVRGARACTGLDLRPAPLRREREGRRGGGCLPEKCGERPRVTLTWRQLRECSHPGPGPPTPAPAQTLDFGSSRSPRPSFPSPTPSPGSSPPPPLGGTQDSRLPRGAPAPGPPGRIPSSQNAHALPSPTARPSRSSQNPRPSRPLPGPHPYPGLPGGGGGGSRPGPGPRPPAPHCSQAAVPGPPGHPPGNPGVPHSRLWGLGKAGRQDPAPGDLTP